MALGSGQEHFLKGSEPLIQMKQQGEGEDDGVEATFHKFNDASFAGAVFNLSTTIIGVGVMALLVTMKVLGLAMIMLTALLTNASIELLMCFSRVMGTPSYGSIMGDAFEWWGRRLLQVCIVVNNVGVMIVYIIIIGKIISATLSFYSAWCSTAYVKCEFSQGFGVIYFSSLILLAFLFYIWY